MDKEKVIVISIDAMFLSDLDVLKKKRNCGALLEHSALVKRMHCVYPTYTYPCHTSIMTGCYPEKHGIYHNELFGVNKTEHDWYWWEKDIKVPTMAHVARTHGLSTAAICWPVMAGQDSTDYTIPEIWAETAEEDPTPLFEKASSPSVMPIFLKRKHLLDHMKTPGMDLFSAAAASDIIRSFNPDLLFVHFSYVDHQRHKCGKETEKILHALDFVDERIGEVMDASRAAGSFDDTTFILLGDHGHMTVRKQFLLNQVLAEKGYIQHEGEVVKAWRMMAHPSSFSAEIYTKDISFEEAKKALEDIQREYPSYIERVLTKFEAKELYHLDGPFSFVVEGRDNIIFNPNLIGERITEPVPGDYKTSLSTHGFAPEKGDNPPFVICGRHAKEGAVVEEARLVDEAPTILSLFGIAMEQIDGRKIEGLTK